MKILLTIHHHLDPNAGAPGATLKIGQQYQQHGHQVTYFSSDDLPTFLPSVAGAICFPPLVAKHIATLVQQNAVDVVNASTGDAWVWGKWLQPRHSRSPLLVVQSHGLEPTAHLANLEEAKQGNLQLSWKYPIYHGGYRLWEVVNSLKSADLVFLLNRAERDYAIDQLGLAPERVHVFTNGIPDIFFNQPFTPVPTHADGLIRIATVGSYIQRKGIRYSIPALHAILTRYPHVTMSFIGTQCLEAEVHADFAPALCDRIQVIPTYAHDQLPALLQGHHIKLLPSLSEGFSLALPEAMACGLVPVATAIAGSMEIVTNQNNGILVPVRDSKAIETALEQLIQNRPWLEQLRLKAYATAQNYGWKHIAQQRLTVYQNAIEKKHSL